MATKQKKPRKVEPTQKMRKAFDTLVVNGGVKADAMRAAKYSAAVVKNPDKVTKSKGWQMLLDEYLPQHELTVKHKALLNAVDNERIDFSADMEDEEITEIIEQKYSYVVAHIETFKDKHGDAIRKIAYCAKPNNKACKEGLQMAYELRDSFPNKNEAPGVAVQVNVNNDRGDY